jgi:ATP-dependent Clp protease ATP-binding subunit ClpA
MPKINVYLPDDLADAVRDSGVPVSAICQRALEQAVRRVTAIREATLEDLDPARFATRLPAFTARLVSCLTLATQRAQATVTTGDLLHGVLAEGSNLALQILTAMEIPPTTLTAPTTAEPGDPHRFSRPAAAALELEVGEAIGFGHNYVGCEHLLIALAAEPDGAAGHHLRERGADPKAVRRAVAAAVAGYAHLRASTGTAPTQALRAAMQAELAPLVARVERLESRLS